MTASHDIMKTKEEIQSSTCPESSRCEHVRLLTARVCELTEENKELTEQLKEAEALAEKLRGMLRMQLADKYNKQSEKSKYINLPADAEPEAAQAAGENANASPENGQPKPRK